MRNRDEAVQSTGGATLAFVNATIGYDRHPALHHVTASFPAGSMTAVVGPNGAGKSTLLKAAIGHIRPIEGSIGVEGCRRSDIAYLPQLAEIDRNFPLPVFDFVAMGLWQRRGAFGGFRRADDEDVARALAGVGLIGFEQRLLDTLSGGQLQRVLFARLTLQDAPLILLDEPFTAVDDRTTDELVNVVANWNAEGRTVIAVLHDLDLVRRRFPRTLLIARQLIAEGDTETVLTSDNLAAARHYIEAWDEAAPYCEVEPTP
ncbi:metal ABC transporter ATP-binding protein [Pleomorphomonas oryzae]|uniref:metal ABC transporter ATP-binding protein n=1 Tax=Pleomorphomonas oryzae TaxID=261934 RepID=UPI0004256D69|nr:ABC transporter ATP-binding protein [Pleomorphomonas oryzae]